jgi:hypothetical protein
MENPSSLQKGSYVDGMHKLIKPPRFIYECNAEDLLRCYGHGAGQHVGTPTKGLPTNVSQLAE